LVHRPRVLFLDEPTTGVDAVSRQEFWEMLQRLKAEGITIVVSTPYMDEAVLCDRVALMQNGRLLRVDTPATIEAAYERPLLAVKAADRYALLQALRAFPHAHTVYPFGESLHYTDARPTADPDALWVTEVWETEEMHRNSLSLPQVQDAIGRAKPILAGFGERFVTEPAGGHGLDVR